MSQQRVARIMGIAFVLVAVLGFITSGTSMEADPEHAPRLLRVFPVNLMHNLVHLLFGVWGLVAAQRFDPARTFLRGAGILYLGLVVLAFVTPTLFGTTPIGSNNIWLHALLGLTMTYFGFRRERIAATV